MNSVWIKFLTLQSMDNGNDTECPDEFVAFRTPVLGYLIHDFVMALSKFLTQLKFFTKSKWNSVRDILTGVFWHAYMVTSIVYSFIAQLIDWVSTQAISLESRGAI